MGCIYVEIDSLHVKSDKENITMGKNKPRHHPDKLQNRMGKYCSYYEEHDNFACCEHGWDITKCKGNPHNCKKVEYQTLASRSDKQKNDGVGITRNHY